MSDPQQTILASFGTATIGRQKAGPRWSKISGHPDLAIDPKEALRFAPIESAPELFRKDIKSYIQGSYVLNADLCYVVDISDELDLPTAWAPTSPFSSDLETAMTASRKILEIPVSPDDGVDTRYLEETWRRATTLLRQLAQMFWEENKAFLPVPSIGPAEAASIDLFWEFEDLTLLINIPEDAAKGATFYGRRLGTSKISGLIGNDDAEPRHLIGWLVGRE